MRTNAVLSAHISFVDVPMQRSAKRRHSVNVLLSESEFARFQEYCETRGYKKSTLIALLIREHLNEEQISVQSRFEIDEGERE